MWAATVRTCFGNKTVAVHRIGTRLAMENRSKDGRPNLLGTVHGCDYRDPDRGGGPVLPCYQMVFDDGEVEYVAIEDVGDPKGYWRVLSS